MLFAIPSSSVNSGMDYYSKLLALAVRERLTHYFHSKYLQKMFYYKVNINALNICRFATWIVEFQTLIRDLLRILTSGLRVLPTYISISLSQYLIWFSSLVNWQSLLDGLDQC